MDSKELLLTRRSVRQYNGTKISKDEIKTLLTYAMNAPSAMDKQEWEFIVVQDDTVLKQIKEVHPYCSFADQAGTVVIVCGDTHKEFLSGHWIVDTSAATENLLLGAHEMGLGACWCGIFPTEERMEKFQQILHLPDHIKPLALCVVGHPITPKKEYRERYDENKVHYEQW